MGIEAGARSSWGALAGAALAVGAGCALLLALGAPSRMPIVNGVSLLIGLGGLTIIWALDRAGASVKTGSLALLVASLVIPLTALVGPSADGVARWLVIGGLTIQPAMIVVPLLVVGLALHPSLPRLAAVIIAAFGLTLQPDPGGAAMLMLGTVAPLVAQKARNTRLGIAAIISFIALAVAAGRNIALPPVPFVEHVIPDALTAGPLAILLLVAATILMFAPAWSRRTEAPQIAFAAVWFGALLAALVGYFPTPVIGFGGSGALGYLLSAGLMVLRRRTERP